MAPCIGLLSAAAEPVAVACVQNPLEKTPVDCAYDTLINAEYMAAEFLTFNCLRTMVGNFIATAYFPRKCEEWHGRVATDDFCLRLAC